MTDEYMEKLIENFLFYIRNESKIDEKRYPEVVQCMFVAWVEATRQADIRNSIK